MESKTGLKLKVYYFFCDYRSNVLNIHCQKHSWNGEEETDDFWQCFDYFSDDDVESIHHSDE